ncbi:hypothetical protein [Sulfitobacter sp. M22]|uniref:hypothetical protein n=1 Tax=Sulfitobacter sp. M22 TaxID=2675332 RepID=UPI001F2751BF|nr:hypothetical protein [Sulfitobacter sp. M22]MCF7728668.1 hypothetical protein [Sulfitobacter sp. M22]
MAVSVKKQWRMYSKALEDEFEFAASVGLSDAAFKVRDALGQHIDDISDGGAVNFTKKAFRVSKYAKKTDLEAEVMSKDNAQYVVKAVTGGVRTTGDPATSKLGVLIPGPAAKKNKFGNLSRRFIANQLKRPDVFMTDLGDDGSVEVVKRKKRTKRNRKGGLQILAVFKKRVSQKPLDGWDLEGVSGRVLDETLSKNFKEAVQDIRKYGRVRSRKQRDK